MNEGEYLVLVNELRDQYNAMKEKYEIELNSLKQELEFIKEPYKFQYNLDQFNSPRPQVRRAQYSNTNPLNLNQYNYY